MMSLVHKLEITTENDDLISINFIPFIRDIVNVNVIFWVRSLLWLLYENNKLTVPCMYRFNDRYTDHVNRLNCYVMIIQMFIFRNVWFHILTIHVMYVLPSYDPFCFFSRVFLLWFFFGSFRKHSTLWSLLHAFRFYLVWVSHCSTVKNVRFPVEMVGSNVFSGI